MNRFEIARMVNKDFSEKVLAVVDIYFPHVDFTLKECRLVRTDKGMFVGVNRYELKKPYTLKNGEEVAHKSAGWFGKKHRDELTEVVAAAYDPDRPANVYYKEFETESDFYSGAKSNGGEKHPLTDKATKALDGLPF